MMCPEGFSVHHYVQGQKKPIPSAKGWVLQMMGIIDLRLLLFPLAEEHYSQRQHNPNSD